MFDGNVSTTNIAVSTSWKTDKQMPPSPDHVSGFHTLGDESDGYPVSVRSRLSVCTISYLARHVTLPVLPSVPAVARATRSPARTTVYHVPTSLDSHGVPPLLTSCCLQLLRRWRCKFTRNLLAARAWASEIVQQPKPKGETRRSSSVQVRSEVLQHAGPCRIRCKRCWTAQTLEKVSA